MIFKSHQLRGIKSGDITLAFRRWEKPNVKKGGTMKTFLGVITVVDVEKVNAKSITATDAKKAGYDGVESLLTAINKAKTGEIYKVKVKFAGEDPRIELREKTEPGDEMDKLIAKLQRLDKTRGPWVLLVLQLIKKNPERRAGDLADIMHMDKLDFKINVRKLKNLGLTISHEIGYSISPLGDVVIDRLRRKN